MLASAKAKQLLDNVLGEARKQGRSARGLGEVTAMATLRSERGGHTRFAVNDVTQAAELERVQLIVQLGLGRRRASATTNQTDGAALEDVVARALRLARLSPENPEAMPPLGPQRYAPGKSAVDAATAKAGAPARAAAARQAIELARAAKLHIAGFYEHTTHSTSLASSAGLWAHHEGTTAHYSCSARTLDGKGSGSAGGAGWRLADLDGERYATTAIAKAKASAAPRRLDPGKYTVVLEPVATAALTRFVSDSLDARGAEEGRTFFSKAGTAGATRVGERLFPEWITLTSDPADHATDGMPFDLEGVPQRPVRWIDKGVLTGLPTDRYWAHKRGAPATGTPSGWGFAGGTATRDELIKGVTRGLLITRFFYLGLVDPQTLLVTGLTRNGVFLIERGAIVGPVNNFRFNHSAAALLERCDALGAAEVASIDGFARLRAPWLRSHDFQLTSISEAI